MSTDSKKALASKTRAPRYDINTDVRLRPITEQTWQSGKTRNVSSTGVLLDAEEVLPEDTLVLLKMHVPVPLCGGRTIQVECRGRVVRSAQAGGEGNPELAVSVSSFEVFEGVLPENRSASQTQAGRDLIASLKNQVALIVVTTEVLAESKVDPITSARLRSLREAALQVASTVEKLRN